MRRARRPSSCPPPPASAARAHVVGIVLLALVLQALSPLLHARLMSLQAALTGQRIDVAVFCLPGHTTPPVTDVGGGPPPTRLADCPLCVGGAAPAADLPAPSDVAIPPPAAVADASVMSSATPRWARAIAAHRPRGPPVV